MTEQQMEDYVRTRIPLGRSAQPEDIARGTLFLASDLARFVTGQTIFITGGSLMMP
jgi:NAD(P)-dependent dehydrogenase (short-subunit alcohol dehydrogenase family)